MNVVKSRHVSWVDIENPIETDVIEIAKKHAIHPLVQQELLVATYRPKLEEYEDHLYLVLHFPVFDKKKKTTLSRELDFIIFPYNLLTVHYEDIPQLDAFHEFLAGHEAVRERSFGVNSGHLLYTIVSRLFLISQKELNTIEDRVQQLENQVFARTMHEALEDIAEVKHDILSFRKSLKPQQVVLDSLAARGTRFFGPEISTYLNDIKTEYIQLWNSVEDLQEMVDIIYETHASIVSANTNQVMKVLTVMAALLLPATLIGTIYGMNFRDIPFTQAPNGFWTVIGLMVITVFAIYRYFKYRKWL
jgi:magnesium transporter